MVDLGIEVNEVIFESVLVYNLKNLFRVWFNFIFYREIGLMVVEYLEFEFGIFYIDIIFMGVVEIVCCIWKIQQVVNV